jgi:hypothetical protein
VVTTERWRGFGRGLSAAIAATALACTAHAAALETAPSAPPRDPGWVRYINARFGLRVDLPESGFRQTLSPDGHGVTLTSRDRAITIEVHANWLGSILPDATESAGKSIATLHGHAMAQTRQKGGSVTYSLRRDDFYVISGTLGATVYYERVAISPVCPDVFNAIRVKYPQAIEQELDRLVTRVSLSLRAACPSRVE